MKERIATLQTGDLVARPVWLFLGATLILTAFLMPLPQRAAAFWILVRLGVLLLSSVCFVLAGIKPPTVERSRLGWLRTHRGVCLYLMLLLIVYALISGKANDWSADYALSDYSDPVSYFVQAKIFAAGHLSVPAPQPRAFFSTPNVLKGDRFFSKYPPGWPAILALGVVLQVPWMINPLITVMYLALVFRLGRVLYDMQTAWTAMILASLSPQVILFAAYYFSEPAALLFATLAVLALVRSQESRSLLNGFLCGTSLGVLSLIRPYTALALAVPLALYSLLLLRRRVALLPAAGVAAVTCGLFVALHLGYNHISTGRALTFPYILYNPNDAPSFGYHAGESGLPVNYYGPYEAGKALLMAAVQANVLTLPFGLVLILLALLNRRRQGDLLLGACIASMIAFHVFYFGQQNRYWIPVMFAFALLSARGAAATACGLKKRFPALRAEHIRFSLLLPLVIAVILITILNVAQMLRRNATLADPYRCVMRNRLSNAIVFMASSPTRFFTADPSDFEKVHQGNAIGFYVQSAPAFNAPVLFVRDLGDRNEGLIRQYPNRTAYRYVFNQKTGEGQIYPISEAPQPDRTRLR